ncbi:MAG: VPLPA-CTERM sorting domain-containing protein [Candidatus Heimdallarchaeota archaeon]|nr:VPLPA-CTERM sorting domain-containing protein [Candidatus Heimdallarchaeota archaeon]
MLSGAMSQLAIAATPTDYYKYYDTATYGTINNSYLKFNDWGYKGPTGVGANDFVVTSTVTGITGFDATRIGQEQNVRTLPADGLTPDARYNISSEYSYGDDYRNASMDNVITFDGWGYSMPESYFNNMQIDRAGNYYVPKSGMDFGFVDMFNYEDDGANVPLEPYGYPQAGAHDTIINFQPYGISDGKGWCGSVLASGAGETAIMAGQITFDIVFDVYANDGDPSTNSNPAPQVIPGLIMRSYGSYEITTELVGGERQTFNGSAVINNTNPLSNPLDENGEIIVNNNPALDAAYNNRVSFLGADVIPLGAWMSADSYDEFGNRVKDPITNRWLATVVPEGTPGAVWHSNGFGGKAFLMRADGERIVTFTGGPNRADWTDYAPEYIGLESLSPVPVPAAVWLFGSGLLGIACAARRRNDT